MISKVKLARQIRRTIFGKQVTCFPNFAFLGTSTLKLVGQLAQGGAQAT